MQSSAAVKVAVYWGDILYDTVLCRASSSITVGKKPDSTFLLDLDPGIHSDHIEILRVRDNNQAELQFTDAVEGHVRLGTGLLTLGSAIKKNAAIKLPNGMYHLLLGQADSAELVFGHVSFHIDWVPSKKPLRRTSILSLGNILWTIAFLLLAVPIGYYLALPWVKPEEEQKPPERLVTLLPKEKPLPPAPRKAEVRKDAPAEAALGERKTPDGGAQKGEIGKAELVTPKAPKINKKTKIAKAPPAGRFTKHSAANATSAAQTLRDANLGSLVKGLASLDAAEAPAPTNREGYVAPIQQTGTGGFSTEGLKKGGGGKSVGIGRTVGQGEGGFEGTGRLGLSGTSIGARGLGHDGGRAPSQTSGGLDRDVIDNIVRQRKDRIRLCYERQLNFFPRLSGKLTVHFEIDAGGTVLSAGILEDTMKNAKVRSCVLAEVSSWTFPKPQGGVVVPVDYPFVFESSSHGQ